MMDITQSVGDVSQKIFHVDQPQLNQFQIGDENSDVTVRLGVVSMRCHKRVLESMSAYFKCKFNTTLEDNNTNVVELEADDQESVKSLIEMAYSSQLSVDVNNVKDIAVAADYLLMDKLKLFCENFFIEELDSSKVFGFRHFGLDLCLPNLVIRADKFIASNFAECASGDEFLSLDKDEVVSLISRPDLEVKFEEDIFKSLEAWTNHCSVTRSRHIYELLKQVRLAAIRPEYLAKTIATFPACKSSTGCQQLISNAELYHSYPSLRNKIDVGEIKPRGFPSGKIYVANSHSILSFVKEQYGEPVRVNIFLRTRGCATIDKKIYTTGGRHFDQVTRVENSFNQVNVYSPDDNNSSTVMPAMNHNRAAHGCCAHAGNLFVCGGKNGFSSTCCEKLIIKEDKWMFVAEMNEARRNFQAVSCGNLIWAIGGRAPFSSVKGKVLNSTEFYNDVTDKWTISTPMIESRHGHSAVAFREDIYVLGGGNNHVSRIRSAEKLDTTSEQWTAINSMKVPRNWFGAAISEHKLYCFGGNYGNKTTVEYFDLYKEVWFDKVDVDDAKISFFRQHVTAVTVYGI